MNKMIIKIYLSFIIQVKENKYRIFSGIAGVQTDNRSRPSAVDYGKRGYCYFH